MNDTEEGVARSVGELTIDLVNSTIGNASSELLAFWLLVGACLLVAATLASFFVNKWFLKKDQQNNHPIALAVFFAWVVIGLLYLAISHVELIETQPRGESFEFKSPSDVGSYLSFKLGLLTSAIVAVIGLLAAWLAQKYIDRQGEVAILTFSEKNFMYLTRRFRMFGSAMRKIFTERYLLEQILGNPDLIASVIKDARDEDDIAGYIERRLKEELPEVNKTLLEMGELLEQSARALEQLAEHPFSHAILKEEMFGPNAEKNIIPLLAPDTRDDLINNEDFSQYAFVCRDLLELAWQLRAMSEKISYVSILRSFQYLPDPFNSADLVGLAMEYRIYKFNNQKKSEGERYLIVNVGAALLITIFQIFPDRERVLKLFKRLFPQRSDVAETFTKYAGPDVSSILALSHREFIKLHIPNADKYVIGKNKTLKIPNSIANLNHGGLVFYVQEPNKEPERYDADVHGKLSWSNLSVYEIN